MISLELMKSSEVRKAGDRSNDIAVFQYCKNYNPELENLFSNQPLDLRAESILGN